MVLGLRGYKKARPFVMKGRAEKAVSFGLAGGLRSVVNLNALLSGLFAFKTRQNLSQDASFVKQKRPTGQNKCSEKNTQRERSSQAKV